VPILFFGDLDAYRASPLQVVTVGLNPSRKEFPADDPFRCFPLAEGSREPSRYLDAMSAYFRIDPYSGWFKAVKPLLNGLRVTAKAPHRPRFTRISARPWRRTRLDKADHAALEADGGPLWQKLLEELRPQIVVISVAKAHLERIEFEPVANCECIRAFKRLTD